MSQRDVLKLFKGKKTSVVKIFHSYLKIFTVCLIVFFFFLTIIAHSVKNRIELSKDIAHAEQVVRDCDKKILSLKKQIQENIEEAHRVELSIKDLRYIMFGTDMRFYDKHDFKMWEKFHE